MTDMNEVNELNWIDEVENEPFNIESDKGGPVERGVRVKVKGPLVCSQHGREVPFIFDYATKTYHHVHKNGGLCSSPVQIKRW